MDSRQSNANQKFFVIAGIVALVIIAAVIAFNKKDETSVGGAAGVGTNQPAAATSNEADTSTSPTTSSAYKDGTYTESASYRTPETTETIKVSLTIADGVVTSSSVSQVPQDRESEQYQADFANNYKPEVVGKSIDSISLTRISGSSLTPIGFNDALEQIKADAKA